MMTFGETLIRELTAKVAPRTRGLPRIVWIPLATLAYFIENPILRIADGVIVGSHLQNWLKTEFSRYRVLNTLHGFKRELISAFASGIKA
jgi:hypothetical protein